MILLVNGETLWSKNVGSHYLAVLSLSFGSAGKGQFLTSIFKTTYIVSVNLQEVAGGKKFLELLLEAVNFTGYHLIRRTLYCG